jgi:hypothetical protein
VAGIAPCAGAQTGEAAEEPIGPVSGDRDAAYRARLRAHVSRAAQQRAPTPPDGPDVPLDDGRGNLQCESSIAIDPNDELHVVGVAIDFAAGFAQTAWYTTFDGGTTWTSGIFANEPGFALNGDPTVVITPGGVPVISILQYWGAGGSGVYSYRSLNGGSSWQAPVLVDLDSANDKVQSACDLSGGPWHGQVALAWDRFFTGQGDTIFTAVSDDEGVTWRDVQRIDDVDFKQAISPDVAYGPGSELWVMWADRGDLAIRVDVSRDGGATFGADITAGTYLQVPVTLPNNFFRIFDIFSLAVDTSGGPYDGRIYIAYHRWGGAPKNADVWVIRSADDGATWTKSNVNVADTSGSHQLFPWVDVDPHGNVNLTFYDCRLDPSNYLLWNWVARSSNGGSKWSEYVVSDAGFDFGASGAWYLGDYIGLASSEHHVRPFFAADDGTLLGLVTDDVHLDCHSDIDQVSVATGGVVKFTVNIGPNHSGENYWLFGSLSSQAGLDIGPIHLPLDYDSLFELTLAFLNSPTFQNSLGVLDATGSALVTVDSGGPLDPSLAGQDTFWAAYVFGKRPVYGSNATRVSLIP